MGQEWEILPPRTFEFAAISGSVEETIEIQFQRELLDSGWILSLESNDKVLSTDWPNCCDKVPLKVTTHNGVIMVVANNFNRICTIILIHVVTSLHISPKPTPIHVLSTLKLHCVTHGPLESYASRLNGLHELGLGHDDN